MVSFLKKLICYFRIIEVYEKNNASNINLSKKYEFRIYRSIKNVKSKKILDYFKNYKNKKKRFKNKCIFLTLTKNKELVSSGWLYFGKNWSITEINRNLYNLNKFIIFDFLTPVKFRNKGFYTKLLKLILSKFKNKTILIYVLITNRKSIRAITKAGFYFKYRLTKLF